MYTRRSKAHYCFSQNRMKVELTCPHCGHKQIVEAPQDKCLAFHKCEKCQQMISVLEGSDNCCVICEYSDAICPIGHKQN